MARNSKCYWSAAMLAFLAACCPGSVFAQEFPNRSIKVIIPFPAGGPVDTLARVIGEGFRARTGQNFVVESRPGANTSIGAMACKNAEPDGYTICLLASATVSINPHLYPDLRYSRADLAPVTNVSISKVLLMVNKDVPVKTFAELVAWSKQNPDKSNYASFGVGGEIHLAGEWLKKLTGAQMTHVPFAGFAPAITAFDRGDIQVLLPFAIPPVMERIRTGAAKPLLVIGDSKYDPLPDLPTVVEAGLPPIGFETWFGMFAPAGTPSPMIEKLSAEIRAVITDKVFAEKYLTSAGMAPAPMTPAAFGAFLESDSRKALELIKVSGVTLEK